jgi:hypothetical protein
VPNQAFLTGSPAPVVIAPDLLALFDGARPHPDVQTPERFVTVADLVAEARSASASGDRAAPVVLRWDGPRQQFAL